MTQLTWLQASQLKSGERVVFAEAHDIFPEALVPQGTKATVPAWCGRAHISTMGIGRAGYPAARSAFPALSDCRKENRGTGHASVG
jgi:hypothetical protein